MFNALRKGFGLTAKTMFRPAVTYEYPEKAKPVAPRWHGRHVLNRHADGLEKCVGCRPGGHLAGGDVDALEVVEPGGEQHHLTVTRDRAAHQPGIAALRHDRDPGPGAGAHDRGNLLGGPGPHHQPRPPAEPARPVDLVRGPQRRVGQHVRRPDDAGQLLHQRIPHPAGVPPTGWRLPDLAAGQLRRGPARRRPGQAGRSGAATWTFTSAEAEHDVVVDDLASPTLLGGTWSRSFERPGAALRVRPGAAGLTPTSRRGGRGTHRRR